MTKIDKADLENIRLIVKESKINSVAKIKIKKNDYEIEITSNNFVENNVSVQKIEKNTEIKEVENTNDVVNEDNIVKSPMVGVAYLSADPNSLQALRTRKAISPLFAISIFLNIIQKL